MQKTPFWQALVHLRPRRPSEDTKSSIRLRHPAIEGENRLAHLINESNWSEKTVITNFFQSTFPIRFS